MSSAQKDQASTTRETERGHADRRANANVDAHAKTDPPPKDPPSKKRPKRSIPEEFFDRTVAYLDGPVNARAERVMKSRLVLAPIGLSLTVGSRVALAMRERSVRSLWRTIE